MEQIDVGKQLERAIAAVSALAEAKVEVLAVNLSRETNSPYILIDSQSAQDVILKDKLKIKPGTYDYRVSPQGFISETWKVGFLSCVVWFSFLTIPSNTKSRSDGSRLN